VDDPRVERWLEALLATPGLTAVTDPDEARRVHVQDALAAADFLERGPVVDVGSGGGSPGIPLAAARPELDFVLLEATGKKCAFLREHAAAFPNVDVVCARAEEHSAGDGREAYGAAVARALAAPPVALEWCLPLVEVGGRCVLYTGAVEDDLGRVSAQLGGGAPELVPVRGSERRNLVVVRKLEPTPDRFPRRPGAARKRPLR
jgi:16S rRNA (guanine527-N7)-methyltransferase